MPTTGFTFGGADPAELFAYKPMLNGTQLALKGAPTSYVDRYGDFHSLDEYGGDTDEYMKYYTADANWKKANPSGYGPGGPALQSLLNQASSQTTQAPTVAAPTVATPNLYSGTAQGGATAGGGQVPTVNATSSLPGLSDAYPLYLQAAATADPMANDRSGYRSALYNLVANGSSNFANDPSYQTRLKAGLEGVTRNQAAQGYLGSGNMMQALVDYAGTKASEEYDNQYNRLAQLAGVDKASPTTAAQIMAQYPSQNLAEKSAQFSWGQQSAMLPYQLQQMAASSSAAANDSALAQAQLPYQLQAAALQNQLLNSQAQAALKQAQQNANSLF